MLKSLNSSLNTTSTTTTNPSSSLTPKNYSQTKPLITTSPLKNNKFDKTSDCLYAGKLRACPNNSTYIVYDSGERKDKDFNNSRNELGVINF
mmetsp:Transcript_16949/g.14882  ORF Transcript_16949/g.14882 Transcript_16949/m.14882 type:complete len:92 (-) Transcript_16949:429-704(-)